MDNNYEIVVAENLSPEEAAKQVASVIGKSMDSLKVIQNRISETKGKAENAKDQATKAWLVPVGFFHRTTPALEALQRAGKCQSEALVDISECQELLFQQQFILAQCTKCLFLLCCGNMACARIAVQQIQAQLKGASEEEISDIARNELQKTLQQLKQQVDLLEQQEKLKGKVGQLEEHINTVKEECKNMFKKTESGQMYLRITGIYVVLLVFLIVLLCSSAGVIYLFIRTAR